MRKALAALGVLFFTAHLPFLPSTLGDIDAINFALGVRHFDVTLHQPHPPGYPVYIAAAKASTAALSALGVQAPEARGLAFWSALSGALMIPALFALFRMLDDSVRRAWWATLLTAASPLVWFSALRPLSDVTGLAAAIIAQALLIRAITAAPEGTEKASRQGVFSVTSPFASFLRVNPFSPSPPKHALIVGALAAGLAIGVRSQNFALTLPLFAVALALPGVAAGFTARAGAVAAFTAGILVWAVPLVIASGGLAPYLVALGQQGGEDFSGVVMFWNFPTVAVGLSALRHTFVSPWAAVPLGVVVLTAAAVGVTAIAGRRRTWMMLAAMSVPYAVFHLLFHETVTVRYALPLVPVVAWLAVRGVDRVAPSALPVVVAVISAWGVFLGVSAGVRYGTSPAPIFRAIDDLSSARQTQPVVAASHRRIFTESRRARMWLDEPPRGWLPAPRDFEWLELTRAWRSGSAGAAWFFANPRRTDLALIDANGAQTVSYRWPFDHTVLVGGARPGEFDVRIYTAPGWFLEHGWALTPEAAGITEREGWGPHRRPSVGWIRRREEAAEMVLGGRHLGAPGDPPVRIVATIDGRTILDREVGPGFFLDRIALPSGFSAGEGPHAPLLVRAVASDGSAARIGLEQFDVQSEGVPMIAFDDGWHEPEYEPDTGRMWRWMSERAMLWVRPVGRDVTLTLRAESPMRYFDAAPVVRLNIAGQEVARLAPSSDFTWEVRLPAELLVRGSGRVILESNQSFVPGGAGGGDQRDLAVRVYSVEVR